MPVTELSIERFRNLEPVRLRFSSRLNLFTGENAAGKTSLLEALYVLARARSFRASHLNKAIRSGAGDFQLVARVRQESGREVPVGLGWCPGTLTARIDARPVRRLSELAALFPLQWLGGNLHRLIEEGPVYRRQFLDWGLFHVKPGYAQVWKRYQKILKQRNAALRSGRPLAEIEVWNRELAGAGEALHGLRAAYVQDLMQDLGGIMAGLSGLGEPPDIGYRPGWRAEQSLEEALDSGIERDRERGYTRSGPHRADLSFEVAGKPAVEHYSRGQQKLFVIALQIAQAGLLKRATGESSLFLLDDLGAELDLANQERVMALLYRLDAQVFVTSIQEPDSSIWSRADVRRFHVKHGEVHNVV